MPSRNVIKEYSPHSYYHVYNCGVDQQMIFRQDSDYKFFLGLLKRHLSKNQHFDRFGQSHPHYYGLIELLAFCLMPNHFHLMIYQGADKRIISKFVQSISTAYTLYFNHKYMRRGPLFSGRFRATRITHDEYLLHISRYIHLNPSNFKQYEWSSMPYYLSGYRAEWLIPARIKTLFSDRDDYQKFLEDYEDYKTSLDVIKHELADTTGPGRR